MSDYGFVFAPSGRVEHGAVSSDEEHFSNSLISKSLVRELGQNSIDAKRPGFDGPVRMEFELQYLDPNSLPDVDNLKRHIEAAVKAVGDANNANNRLAPMLDVFDQDSIAVLRIGDYGTRGLAGKEWEEDVSSPLKALTMGSGISAKADLGSGGSFGIGAKAGLLASSIRTLFWGTISDDNPEQVIAGRVQLATHRDPDSGEKVEDTGFYSNRAAGRFEYLRSNQSLFGFQPRTEHGTDVYVLGYRGENEYGDLTEIRNAFLSEFLVAIARGKIVVNATTPSGTWELNEETLGHSISALEGDFGEEVRAYYDALNDPEPSEADINRIGAVRLYVNMTSALKRKYHTTAMRQPLMKVETFRHNVISTPYAAILEVVGDEGNERLRRLEPPAHDSWKADRVGATADDRGAIRDLRNFVKDELRARQNLTSGDELKISGLEQLLPAELKSASTSVDGRSRTGSTSPAEENSESKESATKSGVSKVEDITKKHSNFEAGTVTVQATSGSAGVGVGGKDTGGSTRRKSSGGGNPRSTSPGDGSSRMSGGDIKLRAMSSGPRQLTLILRSVVEENLTGDLELAAVSDLGSEDYDLGIHSAYQETTSGRAPIVVQGNVLKNLTIGASPVRVHLELKNERRIVLGVK